MQATSRFWGVAALTVSLAATGVVVGRPLLLFGAAGVCAWLVGAQYSFVQWLLRTRETLRVDHSFAPERGTTGTEFEVTLTAIAPEATRIPLTVWLSPGPAVAALGPDKRECHLAPGDGHATTTATFRVPIAGPVTFDQPIVEATDRFGLFSQTLRWGRDATLTVDPEIPADGYTRRDAAQRAQAVHTESNGRDKSGYSPRRPSAVRSDDESTTSADRVRWPAIRCQSDGDRPEATRQVALVVDHRSTMGQGPPGETKFDYAREAALGFVELAERAGDRVGLFTVDESGLSDVSVTGPTADRYQSLRNRLHALTATDSGMSVSGTPASVGVGFVGADLGGEAHLRGDDSPFARTILPFLESAPNAVSSADDPLTASIQRAASEFSGEFRTVVFTDDSRPEQLRESVRLANELGSEVLLYLAPSVVFDQNGHGDLTIDYERYRTFESLRRSLDRLSGVTAYEVGPENRVADCTPAEPQQHG